MPSKFKSDPGNMDAMQLAILDSLSEHVLYHDTDLRIRWANKSACASCGLSLETLTGRKCHDIWADRHSVCPDCPVQEAMRTGRPQEVEKVTPDGKAWIVRGYPHFDADGTVIGGIETTLEVTARKATERENRELTEHLKSTSTLLNTILNAIPDVIGLQDSKHHIIRYNQAGYDFVGLPPEDVHGRKCYELIGQSTPCSTCATSEVYRTKRNAQLQRYVPEMDRWLDVRAYPILDEDGNIHRVIEHLRDITREKRAETELKASHERFVTVLDSIEAHIYVADLHTHEILFMNQKMTEDYGADFTGELCYRSFRKEAAPCDVCTNERLLDQAGRSVGVLVWESFNPVTGRWYINHDRAIEWVDGRMVRLQIATDVTQLKTLQQEREKMQAQLQQSLKLEAIGTLAGGVAHDFNNLLMGIQGRTELMMAETGTEHPQTQHLKSIEAYVRSAADLTRQLLGFARGGKYEVYPTEINELLAQTAGMFGRTKKEIQIYQTFQKDLHTVEADRQQLEQVLLNLCVNAWQAMPRGGKIFLQTENVDLDDFAGQPHGLAPGPYVKITVADTGIGMNAETQEKIFDPFFTTKGMGRGTGLGLSSAYGIIKNHNGMIRVDSEEGKGTTFSIYLPASEKPAAKGGETIVARVTGKETILLVDDEPLMLDVGKPMLETLGYRVFTADSGTEAIDVYRMKQKEIDLVILDMVMPGIDGGKAYDRLKDIDPGVKVVLSSGYGINGDASEILDRGCNGFLQKPFDLTSLSETVRRVLDA